MKAKKAVEWNGMNFCCAMEKMNGTVGPHAQVEAQLIEMEC